MTSYKGHIILGYILTILALGGLIWFDYLTLEVEFPYWNILIMALIVPFYAILPDIDIKSSKPFGILLFVFLSAIIWFAYQKNFIYVAILAGILIFLAFFTKHRGFFHGFIFAFISVIPLVFIGWEYALVGLIAVLSHKVGDLF